jgi:hypothetical protein
MPTNDDSQRYDLEDRTFEFAKASRAFVKKLPRTIANIEEAKQLIRASGSSQTCRREAKERGYWLRLLDCDGELESARANLLAEARELMKIFGAIVRKLEE